MLSKKDSVGSVISPSGGSGRETGDDEISASTSGTWS